MPPLCHFYHIQPSELRALTMRQVGDLSDWMDRYIEAERKSNSA